MAIKEKTIWVTGDGMTHSTEIMAKQHEVFLHLCQEFEDFLEMYPRPDPDQIVNRIYNLRGMIRKYLDLTEQMMKDSLEGV